MARAAFFSGLIFLAVMGGNANAALVMVFDDEHPLFSPLVVQSVAYRPASRQVRVTSQFGDLDCGPQDSVFNGDTFDFHLWLDGKTYALSGNFGAAYTPQAQLLRVSSEGEAAGLPRFCQSASAESLTLRIDGHGAVAARAPFAYDLSANSLVLDLNQPAFCFDFGRALGGSQVSMTDFVSGPNGSPAGTLLSGVQSLGWNLQAGSFNFTTVPGLHCFIETGGNLTYISDIQVGPMGTDAIFADVYEARVQTSVQIFAAASASVGQAFNYSIRVSNAGPSFASAVGLQEVFTGNPDLFDLYLDQGSWTCQPEGQFGASDNRDEITGSGGWQSSCGSASSGSGPIRVEDLQIAPGGFILFDVTRQVMGTPPPDGGYIRLRAGAVSDLQPDLNPLGKAATVNVFIAD